MFIKFLTKLVIHSGGGGIRKSVFKFVFILNGNNSCINWRDAATSTATAEVAMMMMPLPFYLSFESHQRRITNLIFGLLKHAKIRPKVFLRDPFDHQKRLNNTGHSIYLRPFVVFFCPKVVVATLLSALAPGVLKSPKDPIAYCIRWSKRSFPVPVHSPKGSL